MDSMDSKPHHHNYIPPFAKIIILAQAAIILAFSVAMYQEYLSNAYLQQYIIALFTSNIIADATLSVVTASVFAVGTFTLLGSMSSKKPTREWRISETSDWEPDLPAMPALETLPQPKSTTRKPRQRKRRANNNDIFRAMSRYSEPTAD
jgi:hypothetical protein